MRAHRTTHRVLPRLRAVIAALTVLTAAGALISAPAQAAPPAELDFARYQAVDAARFQSLRYPDNGRTFFRTGRRICRIGATPGDVACSGSSRTARLGSVGVSITGDMQGPYWVPRGTTFRFGSRAGFRAPILQAGQRISVANVTCAVPRTGVVACSTRNRAFVISRSWHRFYSPRGDRARDSNPPARQLPARLR